MKTLNWLELVHSKEYSNHAKNICFEAIQKGSKLNGLLQI